MNTVWTWANVWLGFVLWHVEDDRNKWAINSMEVPAQNDSFKPQQHVDQLFLVVFRV